ncbi:MAG: ATP-binding protein [Methanobacteriota archaeon]
MTGPRAIGTAPLAHDGQTHRDGGAEPSDARSALTDLAAWLPRGDSLSQESWAFRHRVVVAILIGHGALLPIFGLVEGWPPVVAVLEGFFVLALAGLASWPRLFRRSASVVAATAATTSSAILTQFSGGYIEAHFHFFIMVALISLYLDWVPFAFAVVYIALDHGIVGSIRPEWVYNHAAAIADPWTWAAIHAVFVLAQCAVLVVLWKSVEQARVHSEVVLESASEGILGVDRDGRIAFANPAAADLAGRPIARLLGMPVARILREPPVATNGGGAGVGGGPRTAVLGNAWKFTSKNPEAARIEFGATKRGGEHLFFVRDDGVGFAPEACDALFAPFARLHDSAAFPGTGLGLATVRRIVARHGGRVAAEGAPGKGATFSFTLAPEAPA